MVDHRSGPTQAEIKKVEDEKGKQITQLKADLAEAHGIMECMTQSAITEAKLVKGLDKHVTQLKADLAKFGGHTAECASRSWKPGGRMGTLKVPAGKKCDCGFEKAEERWG